jgi:CelD/BcsL family acetyltransferase involved in cellulose biosynthesis
LLRTTIIENTDDLKCICSIWQELAAQPEATMFQSYSWNETALKAFARRESPRVVLMESDAGAILLPCVIGQKCGTVHFAGETLFDYRNALVRGDESLWRHALEIVADWGLEFESKAFFGDDVRERWAGLPVKFFANAPGVRGANLSVDQFLALHSRLGRHSRRIRKQGAELRRHPGTNRALVSLIYDLKAKQEVPGNLFRDSLRREFMVEIAGRSEADCEIFTYETPGSLVAALLTFRDRTVRRCYTTYFDEKWAPFSPGQVLLFDVVAESLREGLDCDFMTGEYPFKNRIATEMVPLYRVRATTEELRAAAYRETPERIPLAA